MGLNDFFTTIVSQSDDFIVEWLTKIALAVIIIFTGFIIGRIVGKLVYKFLKEIELNNALKKAGIPLQIDKAASKIAKVMIYLIFIIWALNELGITTTVLNILLIAALVILIISFLLAAKDFIPNLISGVSLFNRATIKKGDWVKIEQLEGEVIKTGLLETQLKTKKGDVVHFPNSSLAKKEIIVIKS
jgi:small-conductance mechanosensitive channel